MISLGRKFGLEFYVRESKDGLPYNTRQRKKALSTITVHVNVLMSSLNHLTVKVYNSFVLLLKEMCSDD